MTALTDGCYDLSDNFVDTFRDSVVGGMVSLTDGSTDTTTCPTDGDPDMLTFRTDGFSPADYQYFVTDDQAMILAMPPSNMADLEGAGQGVCRIYGFSYTGDLMASMGMDVSDVTADGCYELSSNFITVNRDTATCITSVRSPAESLGLTLYPVPAQERVSVSFSLPQSGPVAISLVNLQGKTMLQRQTNARRRIISQRA